MAGVIQVEASTADEAIKKAWNMSGLPAGGEYVDASWQVDCEPDVLELVRGNERNR